MDFKKEAEKLNIELTPDMEAKFEGYYAKLVEVNSYMNLTAITEHDEVYNKHFLDSLSIVKALDLNNSFTICDVGSGAGFPSIPLAIVCSNANVIIIDALNKRIKFLNELVAHLGLNNVNAYHKRAEDYAKEKGGSFDVVTARAVARLNILSELCLPLVKINGYFVAMKGQSGQEELAEAVNAISILGGKIENVIDFELPDDAGKRSIVIIKKVKDTPKKYPRQFAKIKERPL
ncbi:MAG: 16S rRNA (guanine(527)-N(7))-methyltransferase RsmG [Erysipelotrichaceae bacterium]|nr:16S rRNA (guanine(527)-N(7))-methyltransferase RsmG [Erysipelotrichaceae bacterium]